MCLQKTGGGFSAADNRNESERDFVPLLIYMGTSFDGTDERKSSADSADQDIRGREPEGKEKEKLEQEKKITDREREEKEKQIIQGIENIQGWKQEHMYPRLKMEFHSWSYEERSITVRFPVQKWELNHMGSMHGGIIATAIDTVCGMTTRHFAGTILTPTVNICINYLLPALDGDAMLVTAKIDHLGKRLVSLSAVCKSENNGKNHCDSDIELHADEGRDGHKA